jgi:uncharacterized protein
VIPAINFSAHAGTVVVQPTPLCNMRCAYCYLDDLSNRSRMDPVLARRLAVDLAACPPGHCTEIRWHAGEPLTLGVERFQQLLEPFEELRGDGRVRHTLQTNGTLIDAGWCALFDRHGIGVGVSIDGPRWANRDRRTLSGAETFDRAMRGIQCLTEHGVRFKTISVVTFAALPTIVERSAEYFDFFRSLGPIEVGFNIEEQDGSHRVGATDDRLVRAFWRAIVDRWCAAGGQPRVRDLARVTEFARLSLAGFDDRRLVDPLPTVAHNGDVVLLSPELSGCRDRRYGDFTVGNLHEDRLSTIVARGLRADYVDEFREGAERCRSHCRYFDYCRAGQASNRYYEHGDFVTNETSFCRHSRQAPFDAVVGVSEHHETTSRSPH